MVSKGSVKKKCKIPLLKGSTFCPHYVIHICIPDESFTDKQ